MAIKTRSELVAQIAANFPDNNSFAITPAKLREYLNNELDSEILFDDTGEETWAPSITVDGGVVTSAAAEIKWYQRIGNIVSGCVLFSFEADFTAGTQGSITFSPPVATADTNTCIGGGNNVVDTTLINCNVSGSSSDLVATLNSAADAPVTAQVSVWFYYQVS